MFKQDYREYFSSEVNPLQTDIEYFKNSPLYNDIITLLTVCLRVVCQPDVFYNKFMIMNTKLGILAELLDNMKKDVMLVSDHDEEYYFTPEKFRPKFKLINWVKNKSITLFYNPDVLIDFNFHIRDIPTLQYFINFLDKQNNPKLILYTITNLGQNLIIEKFEENRYKYEKDLKDNIVNILNNKMNQLDPNNILVFNYIPLPIIKEDIGIISDARIS